MRMGAAFSYRERWAGNKLAEKCAGRFAPRRVSGDRGRQRLRDEKRHAMARPINANLFPTCCDKADARAKICQGVAVG